MFIKLASLMAYNIIAFFFLFGFKEISQGASGAPTAITVTSSTDFANTVQTSTDFSNRTKVYLFCTKGGGVDPNQLCQIRIHALASIGGEVSSNKFSHVELSNIDISSPAHSDGSTQTTGSAGGFSALTDISVDTTLDTDQYAVTQGVPQMALHAFGVTGHTDTAAGGDSPGSPALGPGFTTDPELCFRGTTPADAIYNGTNLASTTSSVISILKQSPNNAAIFELTGYASEEIPRNQIGYANKFTIAFDITVTSNTVGSHASDCSGGVQG